MHSNATSMDCVCFSMLVTVKLIPNVLHISCNRDGASLLVFLCSVREGAQWCRAYCSLGRDHPDGSLFYANNCLGDIFPVLVL